MREEVITLCSEPGDDDGGPAMAAVDLDTVQLQLEQLNIASDVINKFEIQLDEARQNFRDTQVLLHSSYAEENCNTCRLLGQRT